MICNCDFSSKLSLSSFLRQCFLIDVINCIPFTVHTKTSICFYSFPSVRSAQNSCRFLSILYFFPFHHLNCNPILFTQVLTQLSTFLVLIYFFSFYLFLFGFLFSLFRYVAILFPSKLFSWSSNSRERG